jgi:hypothetical protein
VSEDLTRLALVVAGSLDERGGSASAGIVRQLARRCQELERLVGPLAQNGRRGCGAPLSRARTGRPRLWCGRGRCAGRTRENATMVGVEVTGG